MHNQTLPTTSSGITLTRFPYYENSGMGGLLLSEDGNTLIHFDDTGLSIKDYSDPSSLWRLFLEFDDHDGFYYTYGVGSVAQDPADSRTYYFCMGVVGSGVVDSTVDYQTNIDYGGLFRTTDVFTGVTKVSDPDISDVTGLANHADYPSTSDALSRFVLACSGGAQGRYIYEQETGIEQWWTTARHEHFFAFDPRVTVSDPASARPLSQVFYFMSYMYGLFRGEYASDGATIAWRNVHKAPVQYEDSTAYSWTDFRYYEFAPQTNDGATTDKRDVYPADPANPGNCDYTYDGQEVAGEYDAGSGQCVEDENVSIGSAVVIDPLSIDTSLNGAGSLAVLYDGFFTNDLWPHGGLYRGVETGAGTGEFTWTELTHPDDAELPADERRHLDVRDITIDKVETVALATGQRIAKYFYVAAGGNGYFRGEVAADGSVALTALNTGNYTRDQFVLDYTGRGDYSGTGDRDPFLCATTLTCGQAQSIDVARKSDGTVYLFAQDLPGILYYATDNRADPVTWYQICVPEGYYSTCASTLDGALSASQEAEFAAYSPGMSVEAGAIDEAGEKLLIANEYVYKIDMPDLTTPGTHTSGSKTYTVASAAFHAIHEGFGDRNGYSIYDPYRPDSLIHQARLDGGYEYFTWTADYGVDEVHSDWTIEHGFCTATYLVSEVSAYDADGNDVIDSDSALTSAADDLRLTPYGGNLISVAKKGSPGDHVLYVPTNGATTADNGAIYRGDWNTTTGNFTWSNATGEKNCQAKYPQWNANKNSCIYLCDAEDSAATKLPQGGPDELAVNPNDSDHLLVLWYETDRTYNLWTSADGGGSWSDISAQYVDSSGNSLSSYGEASSLIIDPLDASVYYIVFSGKKIFMKEAGKAYFTDITDALSDDSASSNYLSYKSSSTLPGIEDMEAVIKGTQTRLYITVKAFCDGGWGTYPGTPCGTIDGGGIYTRLIGTDTQWTKLNTSGDTQYFTPYDLAISPVDPNHMVAVGLGADLDWSGGGNMADATAGVMYSTDGGTTWQKATTVAVNGRYVTAHPTDANKFVISLETSGVWELDLSNPDSDGDGIPDSFDTADGDSDGTADDADCAPADASIHPGAVETCNGIDDNCDGAVDEGVAMTFYRDADGDTFGLAASARRACRKPPGYAVKRGDCNDACNTCYPGAPIILSDGKDNDCDGRRE